MNASGWRGIKLSIRASLMVTAAGLSFATPAQAQPSTSEAPPQAVDEQSDETDTIVVTGSRIDRPGFEAPTPMTVIGEAELRQGARNNAAEVLGDIPQFRAGANPTSSAGSTTPAAGGDLRGLGGQRTLTLLNGHRFVGDGNLNTIPFAAIKRIDVVTGGASAAYGSGAVAGVVNIMLKDELNGVEVSAQTGISSRGDGATYQASIVGGTDFADGRGNILLAGEYFYTPGIDSVFSRKNVGGYSIIPIGGGRTQITPDVGFTLAAPGGIILSGVLANQQFNPDGTLRPFQFGSFTTGIQTVGGDGFIFPDQDLKLSIPIKRVNLFGSASYDLTDSIRLSGHAHYANVISRAGQLADPNLGNLVISRDNAFLPQAVRNQLVAAGQTSFAFGRTNADFGLITLYGQFETIQGTIALNGTFGDNWRWDAYVSHGEETNTSRVNNQRIRSNYAESVDSVIHPVTGLPVCRSALTVPTTACVPINLFGEGAPSAAALRYVLGTGQRVATSKLDIAAATLRGEPFSIWAGDVSVAVGVEARKESSVSAVDPLSQSSRFITLNLAATSGDFTVKEAFAEVVVPLIRDVPFFKLLEFNGAVRMTDYSTSGTVWSWKLGASNEIMNGLRVRVVRSRDIRAPSISELFAGQTLAFATVIDAGVPIPLVRVLRGGNLDLEPETADTFTAGVVFQPTFAPGLSISADYYKIDISGAISTVSANNIVAGCAAGDTALCAQITRDGTGRLTEVRATLINVANFETSGVDAEIAYRMPLDRISASLPGRLNFRLLGNYTHKLDVVGNGVNRVGDMGAGGIPKWRGTASVTYEGKNMGVDLRARYIHKGRYDSTQTTLVNNEIGSRIYVDLGAQVHVPIKDGSRLTVFGNIRNLFDRDPPILPNSAFYDVIGRYFTAGVRANF